MDVQELNDHYECVYFAYVLGCSEHAKQTLHGLRYPFDLLMSSLLNAILSLRSYKYSVVVTISIRLIRYFASIHSMAI